MRFLLLSPAVGWLTLRSIEIKQWTNVFGVSQTATATKANTPQANYQTNDYGPNVQGIYATGVGHSVPANLSASEAWFGL